MNHTDKLNVKPEPPSKMKQYNQPKGGHDSIALSYQSKKNRHKTPWGQFNPHWLKTTTYSSFK
jgi:hypothetical protein